MKRRRMIWSLAGAMTLVVIGIGAALAFRVFGAEAPAEAALTSPDETASGNATGSPDGNWTVSATSGSPDDGSATFAGYRIEEELGGIGANTAVGRTQDVSGTLRIEGSSITSLSVDVDMTTLRSDEDRRDAQLRMRGLETSSYPTATFELTAPISFDRTPAEGDTVTVEARGELTLHGVTREVTVPVEARWTGDVIEVVAGFEVALADYGIEPPTGFVVLSVADHGTVELHLLFAKP
jgi:polyisoprenoid-binding protein YceI